MSDTSTLPFKKGETLYQGTVPTDAVYDVVGKECKVADPTTGLYVHLRAVKNAAGVTLYGKQPVQLSADGREIAGYATRTSQQAPVLDDSLAAAGVVSNDVCFVIVKGPCTVKTAPVLTGVLVAGSRIVAASIANSTGAGTTNAGVDLVAVATNFTDAATIPLGVIGRAITAATTNNTKTDVRVIVDVRNY